MMDFGGISIHQDWREVISYKSPSPLLGLYLLDAGLSAAIRQQSHTELLALIYTLGAFAQLAKTRASVFCPPTWLLLSCPEAVTPTSSDPPLLDKIELWPLEHLGISPSTFFHLPPAQQKTVALSSLYSYLDTKLSPKKIIDMLIQFGNAPLEMVATMLHPESPWTMTLPQLN
jgi:hypothetical protein